MEEKNTCKREFRILFTSVGRRVELIQAFRAAAEKTEKNLKIFGIDLIDTAPALVFCDEYCSICKINDQAYVPQLLLFCKKNGIDLLIPTIDTELQLLADNTEAFRKNGTKVLISASEKIRLCRNKLYTADFFAACGLNTPASVDEVTEYRGEFPCFIKPKDGSSSINAYKVNNRTELREYSQKIENYIIQPFIEGEEYTVDIFCDFHGNPVFITPRKRLEVRSGEVLKTQMVEDETIVDESLRIIQDFRPCGPLTVQLIRQKETGEDYFIEINPRYGGGVPLSMKAGADSAEIILRLLSGEPVEYQPNAARMGAFYSRYDQSICINQDRNIITVLSISGVTEHLEGIKAVIFDLDDTLYSEKEYVKSGYKKIADSLSHIEYVQDKLWNAFCQGKQAIDELLLEEGIYTEELKERCLAIYRHHKPDIHLYAGAEGLLKNLRKQGLKIGIITDGRPEGQRAKIESLGIESLVDEIIITDELAGKGDIHKFRKPNPTAFRIMKHRLDCDYSAMCYIGDNKRKDFQAPAQLGMQMIWFQNRDGIYNQ